MRRIAARSTQVSFVVLLLLPLAAACSNGSDGGGTGGAAASSGTVSATVSAASGGTGGGGGGGGGGAGATCQERKKAADDQVTAVREANLACAMDADCSSVFTSTECGGSCPEPVNAQGVDDVEAAIAEVNATHCANYQADGCPYAEPSCLQSTPACMGGLCILVY
jgi:hypothetical protein